MSLGLVAYASSDESEESDVDDKYGNDVSQNGDKVTLTVTVNLQSNSEQTNNEYSSIASNSQQENNPILGHISDEEDDILLGVGESSGLHLPEPKQPSPDLHILKLAAVLPQSDPGITLKLPAPKPTSKAVQSKKFEEDELEDLVKPKPVELAQRAQLAKSKQKKIIRITVPDVIDSDSDEDDKSVKKSKLEPAAGKCRLFSLLPQPKHSTVKEAGRALIPHTLTKKPAAKPTPKRPMAPVMNHSLAKASSLSGDEDSDDDDDASGASFFSLGNESRKSLKPLSVLSGMPQIALTSLSNLPAVSVSVSRPEIMASTGTGSLSDAPLHFKGESSFIGPSISGLEQPEMYPLAPDGLDCYSSYGGAEYDMDVNEGNSISDDLPADEIIRLQGKRKRREEINIIEVRADDHTSTDELRKNLTEEVDMISHSKKNAKDLPSSQQKRKHQITYLAHKAKEREFDLKNQWAQNRATKMQTQSKYGF